MNKPLTMDNLEQIAKHNPYLDMRLIRKWQKQKEHLERLGVDFSHSDYLPKSEDFYPRGSQHISLSYFRLPKD